MHIVVFSYFRCLYIYTLRTDFVNSLKISRFICTSPLSRLATAALIILSNLYAQGDEHLEKDIAAGEFLTRTLWSKSLSARQFVRFAS